MKRIKQIMISILFLLPFADSVPQACCTAGTPLLGSLEMSTSQKGILQIGLTYDTNTLQSVYEGAKRLNDDTRERSTKAVLLEINYGFTDRFTLTFLTTFVNQLRKITPVSGSENEVSTKGIGDALVLIKYSLIPLNILDETEFAVGAGIKAPLGTSTLRNGGALLPADMQPGTGSWDGVFWAYFTKGRLFGLPFNFLGNLSYRLNGVNQRYGDFSEGYKFGDELIVSAGFSYRTDLPVDFTLLLRFRKTMADEFDADEIPNTGGNWMSLVPGINVKLPLNLTGRLSAQFPVYRNLTGAQLTTSIRTAIGLFYSFDIL